MSDFVQVISDLSTTILAALLGLILFARLTLFYRLLVAQVLLYLGVDLVGIMLSPDNTIVYNLFMPVETAILLAGAWVLLRQRYAVWYFVGGYVLFITVFALEMQAGTFAYRSAIAEGIVLTVAYLLVLYNLVQKRMSGESVGAIILASLGLILYFACTVPYLSILYYFQKSNPAMNRELFRYIIVFLALLRYFLVAASFVMAFRKRDALRHERA